MKWFPVMKRLFRFLSALLILTAASFGHSNATERKHIAITQIVEHAALNEVREGLLAGLIARGYVENENLIISFENAQGDMSIAGQIARKFAGLDPDVLIAISTPSAQSLAAVNRTKPVIFAAVTDPVGSGLVSNAIFPGGNISGVSDISPLYKHLDLIIEYLPKIKRLGIIYNAGEANSQCLVNLLRFFSVDRNLTIVEAVANRSLDVKSATESLVGKVDAIYIPTDNTVMSAIEAVIQVGQSAKIPVFAGDTAAVERGAVAAIGFDYRQIGFKTADMVDKALRGTAVGTMPVETIEKENLDVNLSAGPSMGVRHPVKVLKRADKIIQKKIPKVLRKPTISSIPSGKEHSCSDPGLFVQMFEAGIMSPPKPTNNAN